MGERLTKHEIMELIKKTDGLSYISINEESVTFFDDEYDDDGREMKVIFPEYLNLEKVFQFNSTPVDKGAFYEAMEMIQTKYTFLGVEKIVFINNEKELGELLEKYPEQSMDFDSCLGIHWVVDNVIVINFALCRKMAKYNPVINVQNELNVCVWETLLHELRHAECSIPFIPLNIISNDDAAEENVEEHARKQFDLLSRHYNYECFYDGGIEA